ncbi:hypothetical protein, conserved [Trypanosoma brucei brucei TREU927]|uniref:Kinetoplastid-specific dual specificity phosphatase n=1 Tax=Trypanosoma brucei brucei (strain 927/4 GUTat10.1) TaxID=185431 RepID=Q38BQ0_TRYB2|nr:hypothetical protein, conserved [Trypanosoma brucei brucei TREU927]EAN77770.1 hypothetical protein, conserved [Trypanosoma brucei brucei TREU927]
MRMIDSEDVAFFFAVMTWNPELLEIMLEKAPNPLYVERAAATEAARFAAAYPLPEETSKPVVSRCRPSARRQRRARKTKRGCGVRLSIPCAFFCEYEAPDFDEEDDFYCEDDEHAMQEKKGEGDPDSSVAEVEHDHEPDPNSYSPVEGWGRNAGNCIGRVVSDSVDSGDKPLGYSMRDFLQIFFQSFLIVSLSQVQSQRVQNEFPLSLSPLERKACEIVHRYKDPFKEILRKYVISGDCEVERHGAQPLFVDGFCIKAVQHEEGEKWAPPHEQLFIAGKDPVYQPLLMEMLGITRVVQCYAEKGANYPATLHACATAVGQAASGNRDRTVHTMQSWHRLLTQHPKLSKSSDGGTDIATANEDFDLPCPSEEEWEKLQGDISRCVTPLQWKTYTVFGPYLVFSATLPFSNGCVTKLVVPAEDKDTYDLSVHFQEGVFRYIHGTPLFPVDVGPALVPKERTRMEDQRSPLLAKSCLLHCSAGMHRSSALVIGYLLWLVALSGGKLPMEGKPTLAFVPGRYASYTHRQGSVFAESYLTVVLRSQQRGSFPTEEVSASPMHAGAAVVSVAPTQEPEREIQEEDVRAKAQLSDEKSILHYCADHVRQQRSMAVPIATALQQLHRYARHLHLA